MQSELRISTHQAVISDRTRDLIEKEVARLESHFQRVIECEVRIDGPSAHHKKGGEYSVHLSLGVPGPDIYVSKQKHTDLHSAVRQAFRTAKRQLDERNWGQRRRGGRRSPKRQAEAET